MAGPNYERIEIDRAGRLALIAQNTARAFVDAEAKRGYVASELGMFRAVVTAILKETDRCSRPSPEPSPRSATAP